MTGFEFGQHDGGRDGKTTPTLTECLDLLGGRGDDQARLPFAAGDVSAGTENEMQVAVAGRGERVDLPLTITSSNYFANIIRRVKAGDTSPQACRQLERYLRQNREDIWENSWVRFPYDRLNPFARSVLARDLRTDRSEEQSPLRSDVGRFFLAEEGEMRLRVPVSYLLKLALADAIGGEGDVCDKLRATGSRLMEHFLSDNTSPETFSFYVVNDRRPGGLGAKVARETGLRYLFSQLLASYANRKFALEENGQQALLFFSPHPPIRQRRLNEAISDAFYRELFMSPCLSGWNQGEEKYRYMVLCHQVLSRSHLNAVMKLREAGIITHNLVVLPQTSNVSLANNGTHLSLGSHRLGRLLADPASGFSGRHEKYMGDLVAKIMEHFLPLFVGTYSAAPYRFDYRDFHPERVLGFLPHQLDYTHLRMIWRRWKKKARNRVCGHSLTPFGPLPLDTVIGRLFGLKGDFVPDFRLVDYPVSLLSTEKNAGQDGILGNDLRLKEDLDALGVFDRRMALYQLYKLRDYEKMNFSGFEARYYSLFASLAGDLGPAADLQRLISLLAFHYMVCGDLDHRHIPSTPSVESERRQIFFGTALGVPTFYVHRRTGNHFLRRILDSVEHVRMSRRYPGYLRVKNSEYRLGLLRLIRQDGAGLIEMLELAETVADLENRLKHGEQSACGRLVAGITGTPLSRRTFTMTAGEFNGEAERYYRTALRPGHLAEAWYFLREAVRALESGMMPLPLEARSLLDSIAGNGGLEKYLDESWMTYTGAEMDSKRLQELIMLMLLVIESESRKERLAAERRYER